MPSTFTHSPAETERKEPGIGGKPPVSRRPTGGGGGGGDDDWSSERRGPRTRLHRARLTVFLLLSADVLMYAVLIVAFYARRASFHIDPRSHEVVGDWHLIHLPRILLLNTAFLALSSITMEMARRAIFRELDVLEEWLGMGKPALKRALPWLAATLTLGTLFLIGQLVAWSQLVAQGFTFGHLATPPSFFFYLMTGFHAAHMVGGIGALIWCLGALGFYKSVERRQIVVDSTAWFWHTTGLVWLMLFAVLATS